MGNTRFSDALQWGACVVAMGLLLAGVLWLVEALSDAAPAPPARPAPAERPLGEADVVGGWLMKWEGREARTDFHPGEYRCQKDGALFVGRWEWAGGRLVMYEASAPGELWGGTWTVRLRRGKRGLSAASEAERPDGFAMEK